MFLMIENKNEAPLESFTVFGASTSRGDDSTIGQFGSGAKFGTLVCMRFGINPIIYSGTDRIEFFCEPMELSGKSFSRVCYKHKSRTEKTSYTLEFGALDWDDCKMGLREYVSNALDYADSVADVTVKIVDKTRARSGYTRIFVPVTPDVQQFYSTLPDRFLQFNKTRQSDTGVLRKVEGGCASIFYRGSLVREVTQGKKKPSLFDYNFSDIKIDESRNMSDYAVRYEAEKELSKTQDVGIIETVLNALDKGQDVWESSFSSFALASGIRWNKLWQETFEKLFGQNAVVVSEAQLPLLPHVKGKGFTPVIIGHAGWYSAFKDASFKTAISVLDDVNDEGHVYREAGEVVMDNARRVWGWLETLGLTKNKDMPPIKEFTLPMDAETKLGGYYKAGVVYMEGESVGDSKVMLEELAHYITGATDNSRDFQDFAFRVAANLGEILA